MSLGSSMHSNPSGQGVPKIPLHWGPMCGIMGGSSFEGERMGPAFAAASKNPHKMMDFILGLRVSKFKDV